jgi:hypothetical protein
MGDCPDELFFYMLGFLGLRDVAHSRSVSRKWNRDLQEPILSRILTQLQGFINACFVNKRLLFEQDSTSLSCNPITGCSSFTFNYSVLLDLDVNAVFRSGVSLVKIYPLLFGFMVKMELIRVDDRTAAWKSKVSIYHRTRGYDIYPAGVYKQKMEQPDVASLDNLNVTNGLLGLSLRYLEHAMGRLKVSTLFLELIKADRQVRLRVSTEVYLLKATGRSEKYVAECAQLFASTVDDLRRR